MRADGTRGVPAPAGARSWLVELVRWAPGLAEAHLPGSGGIDARTRERLILTVGEANHCAVVSWIHGAWSDFLGPAADDGALEPLVAYARSCAQAGAPMDATTLDATFAVAVVRSTRATVARAEIGCIAGNAAEAIVSALRGRRVRGVVSNAPAAVALPLLAPFGALAGAMWLANRIAPAVPEPIMPARDEANLVVHLLADAVPTFLGNTLVRSALLWSPLVLALGVRAEGADATLRIGQGRVEICNGLRADTVVVVDGGLEPLLRIAAGSILRQIGVGHTADRAH